MRLEASTITKWIVLTHLKVLKAWWVRSVIWSIDQGSNQSTWIVASRSDVSYFHCIKLSLREERLLLRNSITVVQRCNEAERILHLALALRHKFFEATRHIVIFLDTTPRIAPGRHEIVILYWRFWCCLFKLIIDLDRLLWASLGFLRRVDGKVNILILMLNVLLQVIWD